jgi:hypothetical protein
MSHLAMHCFMQVEPKVKYPVLMVNLYTNAIAIINILFISTGMVLACILFYLSKSAVGY